MVKRHASFPLDTWTWTAGGSSSLPAARVAAGTSSSPSGFSSLDESDEEEDDDDDDDDDEEDDDFSFSLFVDCFSSSSLSLSSSLCSSSDPGGRLL